MLCLLLGTGFLITPLQMLILAVPLFMRHGDPRAD
jgi:hypothetical protein